jgi:hypothetical protein
VYAADVVSAAFISGQMLGRSKVSLNAVAEQSTVGLIQAVLDAGVALTEVGGEGRGAAHSRQQHLALDGAWAMRTSENTSHST